MMLIRTPPVVDRSVLGQDRDAALSLQRIRVHNQRAHLLVGLKNLALHQHRVDQGRLAVVDVGNDRQVAYRGVAVVAQIY